MLHKMHHHLAYHKTACLEVTSLQSLSIALFLPCLGAMLNCGCQKKQKRNLRIGEKRLVFRCCWSKGWTDNFNSIHISKPRTSYRQSDQKWLQTNVVVCVQAGKFDCSDTWCVTGLCIREFIWHWFFEAKSNSNIYINSNNLNSID